ncbi:TAP-like protein-domain-containing protein [Pyrenochaeta sp. MPI-SDFR-AT-0127]|nr:TAP-like protein-domain-containing protein [Pyrenochaeta sp. MPI-SDFR-AT-0127]
MNGFVLYAAVAAAILPCGFGSLLGARSNGTMVYDFSQLTANPELVWTPCHDNFTCALLEVPLDYSDISVGTVNLAIIKKPGETEDAQEVLVNTGGPGGSSVDFVRLGSAAIQGKIGTQYSLVGIDPRGVKNSGPQSDCFPSARYSFVARNAFLADVFAMPDTTSDYALRQSHEAKLAYGSWCSKIYSANGTAKYCGTVATAQDMLHYVELRAKSKGQPPSEAKLWYYGLSYGSVLGNTFASLYPNRIGRMIIDGVLDLEDYFSGGWKNALVDSDYGIRFFFKRCFEAGPALCSFHQNATSWEELEVRYLNLLDALKEWPVGLGDPTSNSSIGLAESGVIFTPYVLSWRDIVNLLFGTTYMLSPYYIAYMDLVLVALQTRNAEVLATVAFKAQISTYRPTYDDRMTRSLIICLDANGRLNYTEFDDWKRFVYDVTNSSVHGGWNIATYGGPICSKLDVHPPESQTFDGKPKVNGTSTPILYISSIADPITPLPSARKMQSLFPGSGLLTWNSSGHCAHFQQSECISYYEKQYMRDGTLPPENTVCEIAEPNPWIALAKLENLTQNTA